MFGFECKTIILTGIHWNNFLEDKDYLGKKEKAYTVSLPLSNWISFLNHRECNIKKKATSTFNRYNPYFTRGVN